MTTFSAPLRAHPDRDPDINEHSEPLACCSDGCCGACEQCDAHAQDELDWDVELDRRREDEGWRPYIFGEGEPHA